ncbi:MAG TPA: hypothetical protein VLT61_17515 [Anaeromyxobacteraceae bacterium]|nr:hypothetical protein [Anaeromyxobacteraceae bacterium]
MTAAEAWPDDVPAPAEAPGDDVQPEHIGNVLGRVFARLAQDPNALAALLPEKDDLR